MSESMQPGTPKETAFFAEKGMGWKISSHAIPDFTTFAVFADGRLTIWQPNKKARKWYPRHSLDDAAELSKRLGIEWAYRVNRHGGIDMKHEAVSSGYYIAWGTRAHKDKESPCGPICDAAREYLLEGKDA